MMLARELSEQMKSTLRRGAGTFFSREANDAALVMASLSAANFSFGIFTFKMDCEVRTRSEQALCLRLSQFRKQVKG
jgi:hypothetical protein